MSKVINGLKECSKCHEIKPINEFDKRSNRPVGIVAICKLCQAKRNAENKRIIRNLVWEAKDKPCMDCGLKFPPYVMDFDHRPGENKFKNISTMMKSYSIENIKKEIEKCDLVCSNCHRIRTFTRLGFDAMEEINVISQF